MQHFPLFANYIFLLLLLLGEQAVNVLSCDVLITFTLPGGIANAEHHKDEYVRLHVALQVDDESKYARH